MSGLRLAVCGITGRMGQTLVHEIAKQFPDLRLVGGIGSHADVAGHKEPAYPVMTSDNCDHVLGNADVVIDFSTPVALATLLEHAHESLKGKAIVIGTTGLSPEIEAQIDRLSSSAAIVTAANYSIGVNLLLDLVRRAASVLDTQFDIEIVEAHHRSKMDAPSGTALALGRAAAEGRGVDLEEVRIDGRSGDPGIRPAGQIAFHAMRGGSIVGEHRVHFLGDVERLELSHVATDRVLFATGALTAAQWASTRAPGRYTMRDVLGLQE